MVEEKNGEILKKKIERGGSSSPRSTSPVPWKSKSRPDTLAMAAKLSRDLRILCKEGDK